MQQPGSAREAMHRFPAHTAHIETASLTDWPIFPVTE